MVLRQAVHLRQAVIMQPLNVFSESALTGLGFSIRPTIAIGKCPRIMLIYRTWQCLQVPTTPEVLPTFTTVQDLETVSSHPELQSTVIYTNVPIASQLSRSLSLTRHNSQSPVMWHAVQAKMMLLHPSDEWKSKFYVNERLTPRCWVIALCSKQ
eukprot:Gb_26798 [translate_table: standard]